MTITLTQGQEDAMTALGKWMRKRSVGPSNWLFTIDGYAGTGKTTLMQYLINSLDEKPICCAPTNKAASVLRSKLNGVEVKTVHQVLYQPTGKNVEALDRLIAERVSLIADGASLADVRKVDTKINQEKDRLANMKVNFAVKAGLGHLRDKLVIIDEASMVSEKMRDDFCAQGVRAIFIGDSFQLPPVGSRAWFTECKHDVQLTEVMRQALDSPIIRLSMQIRNRKIVVEDFKTPECLICAKDEITYADWLAADQVLTGSNASRQRINRFFRKQLVRDHSHLPVSGDKLICLKNDHHKFPAWINGVQFTATADCSLSECGSYTGLNADYEGVKLDCIEFYEYPCKIHYDSTAEVVEREMLNGMFECDYAYAVTVHKSQGSEWDHVIVADDKMKKDDHAFRQRWLYTAVTRAKKKLILVQ